MCMLQEAGIYLRHELEAHALAYKAIKALPGGAHAHLLPSHPACVPYAGLAQSACKPSPGTQAKSCMVNKQQKRCALYTALQAAIQ